MLDPQAVRLEQAEHFLLLLLAGEDDPPTPRQSEYSWKEILGAAALQGAIFSVVKAVVNRGGARGFEKLTGTWPGD